MSLVLRLGHDAALAALVELLSGEVEGPDLVWSQYRDVLVDIGNGHAEGLMEDGTGDRLVYWPRVWAARAMAYLGDVEATDALVRGISDDHWRVRMTCIQTLGRIGAVGVSNELEKGLEDEHPRVRKATALALTRVG